MTATMATTGALALVTLMTEPPRLPNCPGSHADAYPCHSRRYQKMAATAERGIGMVVEWTMRCRSRMTLPPKSNYTQDYLFPVFLNRQMPRSRPDYDAFVAQIDLDRDADPFEVLARSEGCRATDRIEVFAAPRRTEAGELAALFFARCVRHIDGASEVVGGLNVGDELRLEAESSNVVNSQTILLHSQTGRPVGYVPDYLVGAIHELAERSPRSVAVLVEHVNPVTVAPFTRLLCSLKGPWPDGYQPLSAPEYLPLAQAPLTEP